MKNLKELISFIGGELKGDPSYMITGVEEIECAGPTHITFLENQRYQKHLTTSQAGAVILASAQLPKESERKNYIIHSNPSHAFQLAIEYFLTKPCSGFSGIHPTAVIHPSAQLAPSVEVGPYAVIDANVSVGARCSIGAGAYIGPESILGSDCHIHFKVIIEWGVQIGNRVHIQSGAVIGSDGFGYHTDKKGNHHPLKQLGNVIIEDDVDIGANTTIDRARFKTTRVGRGTKIDNLVQIAHQVSLGENNLIVAQVGIAGSTKTGRQVIMGGQVGVAGHVSLADNIVLTACSAVSKTLDKPGVYYGIPALPGEEFKKERFALKRLIRMIPRLQQLEKHFGHLFPEAKEETHTH